MRYLIANWKMQLSEPESESLARGVVQRWAGEGASADGVSVVLCPSHLALERVASITKGTPVALGAQDAFWMDKGAYTGEISPVTLRELGAEYCLVGHSERREFLGETDEMVNRKTLALLKHGIVPVICVGETRAEREAGKRNAVVIDQVRAALDGVSLVGAQTVVVAYEPRWVIGTGKAVTPDDAAEMHHLIISALHDLLGADVAERQTAVIYGGSADSSNLAAFLAMPGISGTLVGGASLKQDEFAAMARITADAARA
ncbi:MAG: hypothetical protein RLZZ324_1146 [Candidatus Parcubacteria bacterium]|jgi:triosephosphate isomerase